MGSNAARYIWSDSNNTGRNAFALFRRRFELKTKVDTATINLYADSRYRLFVNGARVAYGPIRNNPHFPEFDSIDLKPYLKTGANELLVEVNSRNTRSCQCAPDCRAGFIAWGSIAENSKPVLDLSTPGAWEAKTSHARHPRAQAHTFTLPAGECLDVGLLKREISESAGWHAPLEVTDGPWGELQPRSIPPAGTVHDQPVALRAFRLKNEEQVYGCHVFISNQQRQESKAAKKLFRFPYAAWLHSPREQEIALGVFWGPHYCNGVELPCEYDPVRTKGARQNTRAKLRAGWNLLYGEPECFGEIWGMLIGVPRSSGVQVRAEPDLACPDALRHGEPLDPDALTAARPAVPADAAGLAKLKVKWQTVKAGSLAPLPARYMAWDVPASKLDDAVAGSTITLPADAPTTVVADFDHAFGGWLRVQVDAPPGTVIDTAPGDGLRSDGFVRVCHRPFMEMADRYVLDGPTEIESFHSLGGHHWQLTVRPPAGATGTITLRNVQIRSSGCEFTATGNFQSNDPFFNWLWKATSNTLRASIEDAYIVDSYRERSIYLCDAYVQTLSGRALTRERRVETRTIRLIDQNRKSYNVLTGIPSLGKGWKSNSFQFMWVLCLHNIWSWTGNRELVNELFDSLSMVLDSTEKSAPSGLWNNAGFSCWGESHASRHCDENGTLNAFRYGALLTGAELATVIGKDDLAARWRADAVRVLAAMTERLWNAEHGHYAAGIKDGAHESADPIHANVVALLTGCYTEAHREPLLRFVRERMATNHEKCFKVEDGRIELNFLVFALGALYRHGETELAERVMRNHYGHLFERNALSVVETVHSPDNSLCIAWTCHPMWYLHTRILGVQLAEPGNSRKLVIAPECATLTEASGVFPHELGDIQIAWKIAGQRLQVEIAAPPAVEIQKVEPRGRLARLTLSVKQRTT